MRTEALDIAFRATIYRVDTAEGIFDLRIGRPDPAFDDFLRRQGVSCWAVLTACNPGGVRDDDGNRLRRMRLQQRLQTLGWSFCSACNLADDRMWPEEPGFLLLQVSEQEVRSLASEFCQLACVCGVVGGAPRLVWVQESGDDAVNQQ
ncbi:MAG: DUF3293 domain-containing protein [Propionivibrio sp.]|uniref:DUF3293 domain-containing protein n=1 Tax=Candidatus Propionivibrio dominans TaxID=2954373 RepID=A0A9D7F898_9RHOO|nr:DUF3293 domain-containing protein [Candidatus Propionivibrio dominans]